MLLYQAFEARNFFMIENLQNNLFLILCKFLQKVNSYKKQTICKKETA